MAGLEVELYITRLDHPEIRFEDVGQGEPGPAPEVQVFQRGYQFLSDVRLDGIGDTLEAIRDALWEVGMPPRSIEDEWGPGQIEFTFGPLEGLAAADAMIVLPQRREGDLQPARSARLVHVLARAPELLPFRLAPPPVARGPPFGRQCVRLGRRPVVRVGTTLRGRPARLGTGDGRLRDPTLNSYGRFRPYSFAPDRVTWAANNRGTLISIQGAPGDPGTHIENRLGEPAANPYLWLAANIAAGMEGMAAASEPPPIVDR